jgi:hypothetical protein
MIPLAFAAFQIGASWLLPWHQRQFASFAPPLKSVPPVVELPVVAWPNAEAPRSAKQRNARTRAAIAAARILRGARGRAGVIVSSAPSQGVRCCRAERLFCVWTYGRGGFNASLATDNRQIFQ